MGKQLSESWIHVLSQNMRGMVRDEHVEELNSWFKRLKAYAACLQETWKLGNTTEEHDGTLILISTMAHQQNYANVDPWVWLSC